MSEPVFFPGGSCVALMADSHSSTKMLKRAAEVFRTCDGVFLLGDCSSDAKELSKWLSVPIVTVRGNIDFDRSAPLERSGRLFSPEGPRVFLCHGHKYDVKTSPFTLLYRARELSAQAAFYGHSHIPACTTEEGVLLCNPGALRNGQYALVQLENGRLSVTHKTL